MIPRAASRASEGSSDANNLSCSIAALDTFMQSPLAKNCSTLPHPAQEGELVQRVPQVGCSDGREHGHLAHERPHAMGMRLRAHAAYMAADGGHGDLELQCDLRRGESLAQDAEHLLLRRSEPVGASEKAEHHCVA